MILAIIQARLGSSRLPNKVMQTVGGVPMVKRVWNAAKACRLIDKVVVAWPERYPDLDEQDVLERFRRIAKEFKPDTIVRLTADCPLIKWHDINDAILEFHIRGNPYYSNHYDGHDVQVFTHDYLFSGNTHKEHVIADFTTPNTGLSVNTKADLQRVRGMA